MYLTHMFLVIAIFGLFVSLGKPLAAVPALFVTVIVLSGVLGEAVARFYSEPMNKFLRNKFGDGADRLGSVIDGSGEAQKCKPSFRMIIDPAADSAQHSAAASAFRDGDCPLHFSLRIEQLNCRLAVDIEAHLQARTALLIAQASAQQNRHRSAPEKRAAATKDISS